MRLFITLALVLLTTAPLRLEAQETTPGTLQGRVIDAETGDPLAGAHVFLAGSTLAAVALTLGCSPAPSEPPRQVILILLDAARPERNIVPCSTRAKY